MDIFGLSIDEVACLLSRSLSATKALLHRARENINAFFGNRCSLVVPTNICKCKAWLAFMDRSERLREQARPEFAQEPNFADPKYRSQSRPETMKRVIAMFRNLRLLSPQEGWLDEVSNLLQERYNNRTFRRNYPSL